MLNKLKMFRKKHKDNPEPESIWYCVSTMSYSLFPVPVTKETEDTLTIGGIRVQKKSLTEVYFRTRKEALTFSIEECAGFIRALEGRSNKLKNTMRGAIQELRKEVEHEK